MALCPMCRVPLTREEAAGPLCPFCNKPFLPEENNDEESNRPRKRGRGPEEDEPPITPGLVRKFRDQTHALGALWMIIGAIAVTVAGFALQGNAFLANNIGGGAQVLLLIIGLMGLLWFTLGILTCLKQMWAIYVGLALSYVSLLGQLVNTNFCSSVILILVIFQAHRVIGWAKKMRAAGLPLTTEPD